MTENPTAPVTPLGRVEAPIIKDQAGTKSRPYYIYMYKYTFTDGKVCDHLFLVLHSYGIPDHIQKDIGSRKYACKRSGTHASITLTSKKVLTC